MPDRNQLNNDDEARQGQLNFISEEQPAYAAVDSVDDDARDELLASLLALASVKGIGSVTLGHLFDAGFVNQVWDWNAQQWHRHWSSLPGKQRSIPGELLESKSDLILRRGQEQADELYRQEITFIPRGHNDYPPSLLILDPPPRWIFVRGNLTALGSEAIIAVIGSRKASRLGLKLARKFAEELVARNAIVLAGLAKGIDEEAHRGAVDSYGRTIAVLGHGINANRSSAADVLMRKITERDGLIVSEYLPYEHPSRSKYLRRNELQAALSGLVVPVECPSLASGTGATIRRALRLNRDVVGISPSNHDEPSIHATRENLARLDLPIFPVMNSDASRELWMYLEERFPEHDWSQNPLPRQERFARRLAAEVNEVSRNLGLDEEAIDRLADEIKRVLRRVGS